MDDDLVLIAIAGSLVLLYSFLVLGSFSTIHFRAVTSIVGMACVLLSITSGYGIAFALGLKVSQFNNILPFMVLGIGVDDMFVIVNTID